MTHHHHTPHSLDMQSRATHFHTQVQTTFYYNCNTLHCSISYEQDSNDTVNVDDTYIRLTLGPVSLDIVLCNYIIDYREVFKINFLRI